jgi:hypothetical protein
VPTSQTQHPYPYASDADYLGTVAYNTDSNVNVKLSKFHQLCGFIKHAELGTCQEQNLLIFYSTIAMYMLLYTPEC